VAAALALADRTPDDDAEGPPLAFLRTAIGTYAQVDAATSGRFDYVILQSWREDALAVLRAAPGETAVLAYKNLSFVTCNPSADPQHVPGGVSCDEARERGWILRDAAGQEVGSQHYPGLYLADVGDPAYQERWLALVRAEAAAEGWDGVGIDDVNPEIGWHVGAQRPAGYPSDEAWRRATGEMLAVVGPGLREAGLLAIGNVCCISTPDEAGGVWGEWLEHLSGAAKEHFVKDGREDGYVDEQGWRGHVGLAHETQRRGKLFVAATSADPADERAAAFGLASALLATEGRTLFSLVNAHNSVEPWSSVYEDARALGSPTGDAKEAGGVHRREFQRGVVLVNPTASERTADGVVLPPQSAALVLRER
jgi:hypothetical protein